MSPLHRSCIVLFGGAALSLVSAARAFAQDAVPAFVEGAIGDALSIPEARVEARSYRARVPAGCVPERAEITRPVSASGRYAVKLTGSCSAWAQVELRVFASVAVTTRALRPGETLAGNVAVSEREITVGLEPASVDLTNDAATAARPLSRGAVLERSHVRAASGIAGQPVKVVAQSGALAIEQTGRLVACGPSRACAVLPTGKHVEGRLVAGRLLVEVP